MKKFEKQLKPCPYCGGQAEYIIKRAKRITTGVLRERFIRCSKCHARTQAYGKLDIIVTAWEMGRIYTST
ncbi:MAG: Lar family restriction alleviation protein [Synergistaceae bacterium]|nr:Lar family restriction alleviation protein [Synergistaceae bacterium]